MPQFRATQVSFRSREIKALVDFSSFGGIELYDEYKRHGLFNTHDLDVAAAIGIPMLGALTKAGIPKGTTSRHLGEVVYEGLTSLGINLDLWRFPGAPEEAEQCRQWIATGTLTERKRKIQELLGIQERRSSRYLLVNGEGVCSTTNSLAEVSEPSIFVINAFGFADKVRASRSGALFALEREDRLSPSR